VKHDLPTPEQILEELADKAVTQIDKLASVAFDAALNEMVRYHRFLLSIYAAETPDGVSFNYAEIGGLMPAPHDEWIRQYGRLFERATDRIGDDPSFVVKLGSVPTRLLDDGDAKFSSAVLRRIVDLGPILAHRLEAWVTKRTTVDNAPSEAASPRLTMAGSDRKAYENVLLDVVGEWESLLELCPSLFGWRENRDCPETERWAAFSASWPFIWQHLSNTAYLLAVAVWNEDEMGAELYRDALVRWPTSFSHQLAETLDLQQRRLMFPDVLTSDWSRGLERVKPLLIEYMPTPRPDQLFDAILRGAHDDVVLLTAALSLSWFMTEKQGSDIGARTATALLGRQPADQEDVPRGEPGRRSFRSMFLDMLRLELAGERFDDETHGAQLDKLVSSLDRMSERRVVPGRVYTPSTLYDREGLTLPMLGILLATVPINGDDGLRQRIDRLAENEAALPNQDRSLRDILHQLRRFSTTLENPPMVLRRAVLGLTPDFDERVAALRTIVDDMVMAIEPQRLERLRQRPIDPAKLERLRSAIEAALLTPPAGIPFFRNFTITGLPQRGDPCEYTITDLRKGEFVDPPMEPVSSNFIETVADMVRRDAVNHVLRRLSRRQRKDMVVAAQVEDEAFWQAIADIAGQVGPEPTLLTSTLAAERVRHRFVYLPRPEKPNLKIEPKPRELVAGSFYITTIEGVDIFGTNLKPGSAWLLSARALVSVNYDPLDDKGGHVDLAFERVDDTTAVLRVRYFQSAKWTNDPIFEIRLNESTEEL
jgi:hypothetical protein